MLVCWLGDRKGVWPVVIIELGVGLLVGRQEGRLACSNNRVGCWFVGWATGRASGL